MDVIASRRRNQPAPPGILFDDLVDPHRQPSRPWLRLLADEVEPPLPDDRQFRHIPGWGGAV